MVVAVVVMEEVVVGDVDTSSLQIANESSFFGNATSGMRLFGTESGAVATISALKLVSDDNGTLIIQVPNVSYYLENRQPFFEAPPTIPYSN